MNQKNVGNPWIFSGSIHSTCWVFSVAEVTTELGRNEIHLTSQGVLELLDVYPPRELTKLGSCRKIIIDLKVHHFWVWDMLVGNPRRVTWKPQMTKNKILKTMSITRRIKYRHSQHFH